MKIQVKHTIVYEAYPDAVKQIMNELYKSNSKNNNAIRSALKWEYVYGHLINFTHQDIAEGNVAFDDNPNNIEDSDKRAQAWIKCIPNVSLQGSVGRWSFFVLLPTIPEQVKEYELECAQKAVEREKNKERLTKKEIDTLIKDGLKVKNACF